MSYSTPLLLVSITFLSLICTLKADEVYCKLPASILNYNINDDNPFAVSENTYAALVEYMPVAPAIVAGTFDPPTCAILPNASEVASMLAVTEGFVFFTSDSQTISGYQINEDSLEFFGSYTITNTTKYGYFLWYMAVSGDILVADTTLGLAFYNTSNFGDTDFFVPYGEEIKTSSKPLAITFSGHVVQVVYDNLVLTASVLFENNVVVVSSTPVPAGDVVGGIISPYNNSMSFRFKEGVGGVKVKPTNFWNDIKPSPILGCELANAKGVMSYNYASCGFETPYNTSCLYALISNEILGKTSTVKRIYTDGPTSLSIETITPNVYTPPDVEWLMMFPENDRIQLYNSKTLNLSTWVIPVPPGKYYRDTSDLLLCPPGTYKNNGDLGPCLLCPYGTYQPKHGSSSCLRCPKHRICGGGTRVPIIAPKISTASFYPFESTLEQAVQQQFIKEILNLHPPIFLSICIGLVLIVITIGGAAAILLNCGCKESMFVRVIRALDTNKQIYGFQGLKPNWVGDVTGGLITITMVAVFFLAVAAEIHVFYDFKPTPFLFNDTHDCANSRRTRTSRNTEALFRTDDVYKYYDAMRQNTTMNITVTWKDLFVFVPECSIEAYAFINYKNNTLGFNKDTKSVSFVTSVDTRIIEIGLGNCDVYYSYIEITAKTLCSHPTSVSVHMLTDREEYMPSVSHQVTIVTTGVVRTIEGYRRKQLDGYIGLTAKPPIKTGVAQPCCDYPPLYYTHFRPTLKISLYSNQELFDEYDGLYYSRIGLITAMLFMLTIIFNTGTVANMTLKKIKMIYIMWRNKPKDPYAYNHICNESETATMATR